MSDETRLKTEIDRYGTNYCQHGIIICMPCQTCAYDALKAENESYRAKIAKLWGLLDWLRAGLEHFNNGNDNGQAQYLQTAIDDARAALDGN